MAPQMEGAFDMLLGRATKRNVPNPVPEIEIEGIKELLGHAWDPALTLVSRSFADSTTPGPATADPAEQTGIASGSASTPEGIDQRESGRTQNP